MSKQDLHYIYISGNMRPDHTSLSRFRKNHLDLLSEYFVQITRMAIESGLSDFKQIAIDGSKIQAASSAKHVKTSDDLAQYLNKIRRDIEEYLLSCDLLEDSPDNPNELNEIRHKIDHLKGIEKTILARQKELETRKITLKKEHQKNHKINIAEPEAKT